MYCLQLKLKICRMCVCVCVFVHLFVQSVQLYVRAVYFVRISGVCVCVYILELCGLLITFHNT